MHCLEILRVIHLCGDGGILSVAAFEGGPTRIALPLRTIVADILRLDSRGVMLAHNHPSGDPTPSHADIVATHRLRAVIEPLGVRLHDHVVSGAHGSVSFRALGLL